MVEGFRYTEVGVIPNDWEVKPIAEITSLMTNGFVGTVKSHYTDYENGILYIQGYNVEENAFNYNGIKRVTEEFHKKHLKSCLQEGDMLTIQTGDIGVTTVVPKKLIGSNCHALIITRFKKGTAEPKFYSYYFNFSVGRRKLKEIETGSTMKHINVGDMSQMLIPYPTKAEQTAIATALNDADVLINQLEELLTKKRNIRTGAMQELLNPKEEWTLTTVENLGKPYGGLSGKSKSDFKNGNGPYIPFMNVMSNPIINTTYFDYVKIKPTENQHKAQKGDLFFNGSSETPEEVGMCSILLKEIPNLYLNSFCFGFRLFKEKRTDGLYLAYFFRSSYGRKIFYILAQGATRHNLSKSNFLKIEFKIPKPEEQVRIASILKVMDDEIQKLVKKIEKYKMLKQGMMQVLLTGKIRLVNKNININS